MNHFVVRIAFVKCCIYDDFPRSKPLLDSGREVVQVKS